ncbi:DoxX family protein [Candidatus Uhrbacteria bacterium]|nr:DoxX family protein [Candidatus Uhrbacteria bacterium]
MKGLLCGKSSVSCGEWGLLILRVAVGLVFFAHGAQKLLGWFGGPGIAGTAGFLGQLGFAGAGFWAWALALAEFFGGLGLILGLCTGIAAILLGIVMLVALFTVHLKNGFFAPGGIEYVLVLLAAAAALGLAGPGKWALGERLGCDRNKNVLS